jgi:hypothetical protein
MTPAGYMAKRIEKKPDWLAAPKVVDLYSVSDCVAKNFADYIQYWKQNGYWFFDSPQIIRNLADENSISLEGTSLFYYEADEMEFDGERWNPWSPEPSFPTEVIAPSNKRLEGFDVANFTARTSPECSGLSCSGRADELGTNSHCLFASFEEARTVVGNRSSNESEPGPYRIFGVCSVDWP